MNSITHLLKKKQKYKENATPGNVCIPLSIVIMNQLFESETHKWEHIKKKGNDPRTEKWGRRNSQKENPRENPIHTTTTSTNNYTIICMWLLVYIQVDIAQL